MDSYVPDNIARPKGKHKWKEWEGEKDIHNYRRRFLAHLVEMEDINL